VPGDDRRRLERDWASAGHQSNGWPQFLSSVKIEGLRGWNAEQVDFRFPIVAIAGENGSGKSTILKIAASAYHNTGADQYAKTFNPDDFFPKTQWEDVAGVRLTYTVRRGDQTVSYTLRKPSTRWRGMPERATRRSYFLDISRTQPIDTLIGYGKIAKEVAFGDQEVALSDTERRRLARVLKKEYTDSRMVLAGEGGQQKQVGVLTIDGTTYSNFHQGAGEDSSADLIALLQEAPDHSLVIIDEVEASLHPRAQRRLVTELIDLARRKRLQFIVSTHSPFVLARLPDLARVYLQTAPDGSRSVLYGVSHEYALTMMDDEQHPDLILYAEDERAGYLGAALLADDPERLRRLQFVSTGPANVVKTLGKLGGEGKLPGPSIGLLDADQEPSEGCVVLPGDDSPERVVFGALAESSRWQEFATRLGATPGMVEEAVADAMNLENPHDWPQHVADKLRGPLGTRRIWEEAVDFYVDELLPKAEREAFVEAVTDYLPD
jgi:predicted ATPase